MARRSDNKVQSIAGHTVEITHEGREHCYAAEIERNRALAIARDCGLYGLRRSELALKLDMSLADVSRDLEVLKAYSLGLADHAFTTLRKIYDRGQAGDWKALEFIALHHLNRQKEHDETADLDQLRHLASLPPEERRKRICELTAKLKVG